MERREFLKTGVAGLATVSGLTGLHKVAAAERTRAVTGPIGPDRLAKAAIKHFLQGKRTCGEATVMSGCEALGIKSAIVPDVALGLAGGIGLQGGTCGIVTGSAMVMGIAVGVKERDYSKKTKRVFEAVGKFYQRFEKEFGTTQCREICGLDLTTPEGRKALMGGVKQTKCAKVLDRGARMLAEALSKA